MSVTPPDPRQPSTPSASPIVAALADQHDAQTLAAALIARLIADGRTEIAGAIGSLLTDSDHGAAGIIDPNPGNPHRQARGRP
jgi:hypothetical protein